jgi:hypothetical protein
MSALTPIDQALKAFAAGQIVIVVDNENRENEGDFIMLAEHATPLNIFGGNYGTYKTRKTCRCCERGTGEKTTNNAP